jgi:hypothetical protein
MEVRQKPRKRVLRYPDLPAITADSSDARGLSRHRQRAGPPLFLSCPSRSHDSPHSQMAPNMCANRGWAASIWVNRLMSGSRRKSVMFGMSS